MSEVKLVKSAQTAEATGKLSFLEKVGFGAGDAASNMLFNPITMFLSFFYTDIFGLAPAVVATMFLVVRMFDAFFDPIYGSWMDNRRSKYGRYRKWMAVFTVPFAISCLIMFYTPDLSETAKIAYAFATYLLLSILYSCVNIPYCSLGGVITADPVDRVSCQKFRFIGAGLASLFCTFTLLPLVGYLGGGDRATGFFYTISIFAVIAVFLFFFCFFYTAIIFDPKDIAENLKKAGGFVPGIRPGDKTREYIDNVLTRLTLWGGIYISIISVLPMLLIAQFNVPFYFGGTSLLILVGVAIDFMSQVESHLISQQYEGLMSKARKG